MRIHLGGSLPTACADMAGAISKPAELFRTDGGGSVASVVALRRKSSLPPRKRHTMLRVSAD
jgi:hypothetical protein